MSELLQAAKLLIESWDTGFDSPEIEDDFRAAVERAESSQPVRLSDEELKIIAIEEEFLLFCDQEDFDEIARHIESVVLKKNQ